MNCWITTFRKAHGGTLFIVFVSLAWSFQLYGQSERTFNYEFFINTDNDSYLLSNEDDYYTNGLEIGFQFLLKPIKNQKKKIAGMALGQKIYTPASIKDTTIDFLDRPYAGWLYLQSYLSLFPKDAQLRFAFDLGVTGELSGGEAVQTLLHEVFNFDEPKGWKNQITGELTANASFQYQKEWINLGKWGMYTTTDIQAGTLFTNAKQGVGFRLGRFTPMHATAFSKSRLGEKNLSSEFFFFLGTSAKYVLHDTTIEGSLFSIESVHTEVATDWIFEQQLGIFYAKDRWTLNAIVFFMNNETEEAVSHAYGRLSLGYRFF
ncbi:MAG: lipid A deacylase LpxR family protein [Bacteroidota bacterium]